MANYCPALDVDVSEPSETINDLINTLVDEFRPFAIEELPGNIRRVYFFERSDRAGLLARLNCELGGLGVRGNPIDVRDDGKEWVWRTQQSLKHTQIGELVVSPPWDIPKDSNATVILIQPSTGFGTGHHASTRLCLRALQKYPIRGRSLIDIGTGSGVLAIAAAKLGASSVLAVDTDPDALQSACRNIELNNVKNVVTLRAENILEFKASTEASVVTANLTGRLLHQSAQTIAACVEDHGILILSGLLQEDVQAVADAFEPHTTTQEHHQEDGWECMVLVKGQTANHQRF